MVPTLALLLGVPIPAAAVGRPITEVLRKAFADPAAVYTALDQGLRHLRHLHRLYPTTAPVVCTVATADACEAVRRCLSTTAPRACRSNDRATLGAALLLLT